MDKLYNTIALAIQQYSDLENFVLAITDEAKDLEDEQSIAVILQIHTGALWTVQCAAGSRVHLIQLLQLHMPYSASRFTATYTFTVR